MWACGSPTSMRPCSSSALRSVSAGRQPRARADQPVWTPGRGLERVPLRFCYSVDPPMHIELVEGSGGSVWDAGDAPGTHHVGVWVDDVDAEAERLVSLGWSLEACRSDPVADGTHGIFAYLQPPARACSSRS